MSQARQMPASERVRRGFFRLGMAGAILAVPVVVFHLYLYAEAISTPPSVHYEGRWITIRANATLAEAEQVLRAGEARQELPDVLDLMRTARPQSRPIAERAHELIERAREREREAGSGSKFIIGLTIAASALWFGLCMLVSWIVRGFLT